MVTSPGDAGLNAAPADLAWLRRRVAELEARNEVLAAQLAARNAQLEAAQARLAALAVCAHHLPAARAARLMAAYTGVQVSTGFMAGVRGKAAGRLGPFMDRVRGLLRQAGVLYADETPARAAGHLHYVHIACTEFLTALHAGDRTKEAIDAGGVLPGYTREATRIPTRWATRQSRLAPSAALLSDYRQSFRFGSSPPDRR